MQIEKTANQQALVLQGCLVLVMSTLQNSNLEFVKISFCRLDFRCVLYVFAKPDYKGIFILIDKPRKIKIV